MTARQKKLLLALLLAALTIGAYLPALDAGFIWDDDSYLTENKTLKSPDALYRIWMVPRASPQYYPLVFTSFYIEKSLWGLNPAGYHAVNIFLHFLAAFFLWRVLVFLKTPLPWLCAAVFALHPINVESVAWITERKNVASLAFFMASLLCFLHWDSSQEKAARRRWYIGSFALFVCAMLSKTVASAMPVAAGLCLWYMGRLKVRKIALLSPFLAVGFALGMVTVLMERLHVGASGPIWHMPLVERFLVAGRGFWFYIQKVIFPYQLTFNYPRWEVSASSLIDWAYPLAAIALFAGLLAISRRWRAPLAAMLFYLAGVFPSLGFFNVYPHRYSFVADHFSYHAVAGLIALFVGGGYALTRSFWLLRPKAAFAAVAALLIILFGATYSQSKIYQSHYTLWNDTIAKNPDSWFAYNNLAVFLKDLDREAEALHLLRKALTVRDDLPEVHLNLADSYRRMGDVQRFELHTEKGLGIVSNKPEVHSLLAHYLEGHNRLPEAVRHFSMALVIDPFHEPARIGLARVLTALGLYDEAESHIEIALSQCTACNSAHEAAGDIMAWQARLEEADRHYEKAFDSSAFAPGSLGFKKAWARFVAGRPQEAVTRLEALLEEDPDSGPAFALLAFLLAERGQREAAIEKYRQAARLMPQDPSVLHSLGVLLFDRGDFEEALALFRRAATLKPDFGDAWYSLGLALLQRGSFAQAVAALEQAVLLMEQDPFAHKALADAYLAAGENQKAWQHEKTARELFELQEGHIRPGPAQTRQQ
ncbi:MAG: tetratricopeptide repeat protein [Desulfatibacillaceae bacterium]|nr:tetratricopeptide repeat protein [Desulfatibacillaceae bacterium]